ncbi:MAG: 16S rRNA (cytosine(967)-C(5))-methyltransferase [Rhizobiales bacterium 24-66-13]|jgi:16S rRNA (cytosine967-C5)-methyltransferase|uniref:16S rRNA (cytosine(967)-C(5))-methyltransferase RsmB n=1 Tax=Roseixanthobacter finlandensis TaxID=3119922 RepID=UPI000BC4FC9E|nr:MAG: 16S rRNA (cytosine(967)-C(5))-methyltransferase [Azorhizobium sp. 12-66-6]OYZ78630.1 MAG: 16S rRNA (cytosine(967)-C(5))-methyltransferase [Rhizobiales bacterium 24-66-13]HQS10172.1 16S rRNA (cytosine(967)-C(5))-methyltransferase RsmB [Xanthobacteraceae bacterium]HQS45890.1 16S rRNA (cytosine(967)-C(5))-methyltransferase RsmB [Xanthobacteraceae bacterium]
MKTPSRPRSAARTAPRSPERRPPEAAGLRARLVAADALDRVLRGGTALEDALDNAAGLEPRDRALAFRIVATALRRLGTLRAVVGPMLDRGFPKSAPKVETVLLVGAAQILFMDVPDHAAVGLSVEIARGDGTTSGFAGLINAVLRRLTREGAERLAAIDALAADTPDWLRQRWTKTYGAERAAAICAVHAHEPALDLTVKSDPEGWALKLGGEVLPTGTVRILHAGPVRALPGYEDGEWWVQDAAAALPARLLGDVSGLNVLDLCAAPGGKTAQLAAAGARVTALDRSGQRLVRLSENLARLKLSAEVVEADAADFSGGPYDAILLDAPCTATGTLRRHPDIAWNKRPGDIAGLAELQGRLLDHALDLLKPGGVLVYSTCSLEPEEGEAQIARLLAARPEAERAPLRAEDAPELAPFITPQGDLRTVPSDWVRGEPERSGLDGFFAARIVKGGTRRRG